MVLLFTGIERANLFREILQTYNLQKWQQTERSKRGESEGNSKALSWIEWEHHGQQYGGQVKESGGGQVGS